MSEEITTNLIVRAEKEVQKIGWNIIATSRND